MNYFQPLEVVGRGSETQLQVGGKLNKISGEGQQIHVAYCPNN